MPEKVSYRIRYKKRTKNRNKVYDGWCVIKRELRWKNDPLKLVIMSATICVEDFMENRNLFKDPPFLIQVESRQYQVQVHFNLRTPEDYVESAFSKICKIHSKLPAGAILVFLTGESEIHRLCKLLRDTFPFPKNQSAISTIKERETPSASNAPKNLKRKRKKKSDGANVFVSSLPAKIYLDTYSIEPLESEELQYHQSDDENNINTEITVINKYNAEIPLHVLPLYSFLPLEEQKKVKYFTYRTFFNSCQHFIVVTC
ncbi:probable ATP-dependent RNA helicase DHX37 [Caerostris extrusa]|uniref:Probable ATP-dependent RNA helicase DHX37 n=1 Tax=Caerostris extrusa TaxID=172846 RepID=A0AAV4RDK7_CAEEX|nr:probable ATP-dependent RNA helicase DHX37 [Caerostris extrusa]